VEVTTVAWGMTYYSTMMTLAGEEFVVPALEGVVHKVDKVQVKYFGVCQVQVFTVLSIPPQTICFSEKHSNAEL
jgi:hypothetical protein